jgi:hypothetical protein
MSDLFATKFNYYHHSPSAVQKLTEVDMFQKILRARGDKMFYGSPATVGRAVEDYVISMGNQPMRHSVMRPASWMPMSCCRGIASPIKAT